ncbi:MAG: phosphodiester glycosidase family protein [Candidatus Latescibacterota bacterium]|nr:MAG: phosphodiester glycosidase family protein [Candidatus Latescibacterota bacterium]
MAQIQTISGEPTEPVGGSPPLLARVRVALVLLVILLAPHASFAAWQEVLPGLEFGIFAARRKSVVNDSKIRILRADPQKWALELVCARDHGEANRPARAWAERFDLVAATNAGMFGTDGTTHVGYLVAGTHENNTHVNGYRSAATFDPKTSDAPSFRIHDLEEPRRELESLAEAYETVIQNLRLIKRPGRNRWSQQDKMWSEAALGEDDQGRILFIFCRSPYTMHDLNEELLGLGIGLVAAQHLEGGPEAQLFVAPLELELVGSYETGFNENDDNERAWDVPNVIGLVPRAQDDANAP